MILAYVILLALSVIMAFGMGYVAGEDNAKNLHDFYDAICSADLEIEEEDDIGDDEWC